ncbi:MAG: GDP-mannose 4,6-dehydratase [Congregibacter sp.]
MRRAVVTGAGGQDGQLLVRHLLREGYEVVGARRASTDLDLSSVGRAGFKDVVLDICDTDALVRFIQDTRPEEFYNLAGISAAGGQWDSVDETLATNGTAVLNMLEALRRYSPKTRFCQASSCEIFGAAASGPQNELTAVAPDTPYAIAKAQAHHAVSAYRARYGLFCCSAILYSHSSELRGTDFFLGKLASAVAQISRGEADNFPLFNMHAVRDWGYAPDYMDAMWRMLCADQPGDFIVATGKQHTIEDACKLAFAHIDLDYRDYVRPLNEDRASGGSEFWGDARRIRDQLAWQPSLEFAEMLARMVDYHRISR